MINKILGNPGRMISASKGRYTFENPRNFVVFNANIFDSNGKKLWHGDIDLTLELDKLKEASLELRKTLFILNEMDGRFEKEKSPDLHKAVLMVTGIISTLGTALKDHVELDSQDRYILRKIEEEPIEPYDNISSFKVEDFHIYEIDIEMFRSPEGDSPLSNFSSYVVQCFDKRKLSISDIYITEKDYKILEKQMEEWFIKGCNLEKGSYDLHKNMSWLTLEMPNSFSISGKMPEWVKSGKLYIKRN